MRQVSIIIFNSLLLLLFAFFIRIHNICLLNYFFIVLLDIALLNLECAIDVPLQWIIGVHLEKHIEFVVHTVPVVLIARDLHRRQTRLKRYFHAWLF